MTPSVVIDCFPESAPQYAEGYATVAVDVIRATTTVATAVSLGWRCFPVSSQDAANRLAARLRNPLLSGELRGVVPPGFEMNNSPADLVERTDISRPLILLSSSGTKLIDLCRQSDAVYIGCLRNFASTAQQVAERHSRVAIIGAGSRGQFREEDQICCAWIAHELMEKGFAAADPETLALVERWPVGATAGITSSASADYLIRTGQGRDLEFVLAHVGDIDKAYMLDGDEVVEAGAGESKFVPAQQKPLDPRITVANP
jgi:2-phosphosulfolactate phosphatase